MSAAAVIDRASEAVGKAGGLLAVMMIRKRVPRPDLDKVIEHLEGALKELKELRGGQR